MSQQQEFSNRVSFLANSSAQRRRISSLACTLCLLSLIFFGHTTDVLHADEHYDVKVILKTGEELLLKRPFGQAEIFTADFGLSTDLDLIESIMLKSNGRYQVTFRRGDGLLAQALEGEVRYEGDFGDTQLNLSSIRNLTTQQHRNDSLVDGSFSRDDSRFRTELQFRSGITQVVYLDEDDSPLWLKYKGMSLKVPLGKLSLRYDWTQRTVRLTTSDGRTMVLPFDDSVEITDTRSEIRTPTDTITQIGDGSSSLGTGYANTDLGTLKFPWVSLQNSRPLKAEIQTNDFKPSQLIVFSDDSRIPAAYKTHWCPSDSSGLFDCLKLDGIESEALGWEYIQSIDKDKDQQSGKVRFADGTEKSLEAGIFVFDTELGFLEVPFSSSNLVRIENIASATESAGAFPQQIRFKDGREWSGVVERLNGIDLSTALFSESSDEVLLLYEFPVDMGIWLSEADKLDFNVSNGRVTLAVFDSRRPSTVTKGGPNLNTPYGRFSTTLSEISSVKLLTPTLPEASKLSVLLKLGNGQTHEFRCEKIEFVRYPDKIFNGTLYRQELGAWYWHRDKSIKVKSGDSTVDADLDKLRLLKVFGSYPSWNVELESRQGSSTLKGQIVPAEVASASPGIASWDASKEGFWFSWHQGRAFLFVPLGNVAEIRIRSS